MTLRRLILLLVGAGLISLADVSAQTSPAGGTATAGGASANGASTANPSLTSPDQLDTDGDGLSDWDEVNRTGTDPNNPDTDGDGVPDAEDGWPRTEWITTPPLPEVRYAVVRLQALGWPTNRWTPELDDEGGVLGYGSDINPATGEYASYYWRPGMSPGGVVVPFTPATFNVSAGDWYSWTSGASYSARLYHRTLAADGRVNGRIWTGSTPDVIVGQTWKWGEAATSFAPQEIINGMDVKQRFTAIAGTSNGRTLVIETGLALDPKDNGGFTEYATHRVYSGTSSAMLGQRLEYAGVVNEGFMSRSYTGASFIPVLINTDGVLAGYPITSGDPELLNIGKTDRASIWDHGQVANFGGIVVALPDSTPRVFIGAEQQDADDDYYIDSRVYWAHKQDEAWVREDLLAWDPVTFASRAPSARLRINARLEILPSGNEIIRNGVIRPVVSLMPVGWSNVGGMDINNHGVILASATRTQNSDGSAIAITNQTSEPVLLVPAALQVDANRDGVIDDKDLANSASKPFRFWINDDVDRKGLTAGEEAVQDDDDPSKSIYSNDKDWQRDTIPCERDLEDFSRLWINLSGLQPMLAAPNSSLAVGLKWQNTHGTTPAIKIYPAYEPDGGTGYLTDLSTATQQIGLTVVEDASQSAAATNPLIQPTSGDYDFVLPQSCLQNLTAVQSTLHLLFEGCKRGTGQLTLVILKKDPGGNYTKIGDGSGIYLDLKSIKEMYERWTVGDGPAPGLSLSGSGGGGTPAASAIISQDRLPAGATAGQYTSQSLELKQYILYVHGWNMHPWEKDAFAETAFKRLYWQGYKGRFGAFQWPTTYHAFAPAGLFDYDMGEYSSWLSAGPLKNLLLTLSSAYDGNVHVVAHSMGNVVTGEALRLAAQSGGRPVAAYVATQAAVPVHCYDPNQATPSDFFNSWRSPPGQSIISIYVGSATTPNIYPNWLALNGTAVGTRGNFYNPNDFALSRGAWETDQALKPDGETGLHWPYGFSGEPEVAPPQDSFFSTVQAPGHAGTAHHSLQLGSTTNVLDRYEIMAFAAQPRSRALGAVANPAGLSSSQSLQDMWPSPDPFNNNYKDHPWHSAEFRFTNMDQKKYWRTLLGTNGFNLNSN